MFSFTEAAAQPIWELMGMQRDMLRGIFLLVSSILCQAFIVSSIEYMFFANSHGRREI